MKLELDMQHESDQPSPQESDIRRWINAALEGRRDGDTEISLRLVDNEEMAALNETWRGKKGSTNVLSFPSDLPAELNLPLLGDIVICIPVVQREAQEQGKALDAHWAHMTVHGTLHLLGFDHIEENEALAMETMETDILATLNYPCPYLGEHLEEPVQA